MINMTLLFSILLSSTAASVAASTTKSLYQILNIPKTATPTEIKKAYRSMALKHHPDKVSPSQRSNAEHKFKEISKAYEWLSDEKKRKLYDRYGERSLDPNFNPLGGADNAMGSGAGAAAGGWFPGGAGTRTYSFHNGGGAGPGGFGFPGGMFGGGSASNAFGNSNSHNFSEIDLSEMLRQMMGGVPMGSAGDDSRNSQFFGSSGMNEQNNPFFGYQGEQSQSRRRRRRSDQQQQQQQHHFKRPVYCSLEDLCNGTTKRLKVFFPSIQSEKIYTIQIQPGYKAGTKIKFSSSRSVDTSTGLEVEYPPITFVVTEKKHPFLQHRVGDDDNLYWKCKLTTRQADRGAKLKLPLPDGSVLEVESSPGTRSGEKMIVEGRGMTLKGGLTKGNVVIEFAVVGQ